jgi:hypothetical protein
VLSFGAGPIHEVNFASVLGTPCPDGEGGYPECWWTGFWSYWHDETRSGAWTYSDRGAANRTPPPGSIDGWRYEPDLVNHQADPPGIPPL